MNRLAVSDLFSLEQYARQRVDFRAKVLSHKRHRQVAIGPNTMWLFEDRITVQYQVQEMLRAERIFETEGIEEELEAYNPLIPDGQNWKVTLLIEFPDPVERKPALEKLKGVEDRCYVRVAGFEPVFAIADEDLDRENDEKTSSVHFLRFELSNEMIQGLRKGAQLAIGVDHPAYKHAIDAVPEAVRSALISDFS